MIGVLDSSAVDKRFEPRSGQVKGYNNGIGCFSNKHVVWRWNNKDWIRVMWSEKSTHGLLFQLTIKTKTDTIIISSNVTCSSHYIAEHLLIRRETTTTYSNIKHYCYHLVYFIISLTFNLLLKDMLTCQACCLVWWGDEIVWRALTSFIAHSIWYGWTITIGLACTTNCHICCTYKDK